MNDRDQPSHCQPWIAAALSLCCAGLGHVYCGRLRRGLVLFLLSLLIVPVAAFVAGLALSTTALVGLLVSLQGLLGLWLFAVVDAWRTAARSRESPRHDCQRPIVYVLFVAVGIVSPLLSAVYIRQNLLEAFYIPTASMAPYLHRGDHILVNKARWRTQLLKHHDVVVFRAPDHAERNYIKRIVGLPGEVVTFDGREVRVNGKPVSVPNASATERKTDDADGDDEQEENHEKNKVLVIPAGTCYVLGDNRGNSHDSRDFGPVAVRDILGVAEYVYLPGDTWSRFGRLP